MSPKLRKLLPIIISSFIGTTGLAFSTVMPVLLGGIVDQLDFARSMVGWIASSNIMGIATGGLIATLLIGRVPLISMVSLGLVGLMLFDGISAWVEQPLTMLGVRGLSGVFGGLVYASTMATFSGLKDPLKAFSTYVVVYCLWSFVALLLMPYLLASFGLKAGFHLLVSISFVSLLGSSMIKRLETSVKEKSFLSLNVLLSNKWILLSLLAYFAMHTAGGTIWAYLERIAKDAGLAQEFTGTALGMSRLVSLFGALLIIRMGNKAGVIVPILFTLEGMAVGMILLFYAAIPFIYVVAICLFGGAWSIAIPYFQKIQSQFDAQGKVVSLGTIVNMGGRSVGPAMAAMIVGSSAFSNVIWLGLGAILCSVLLLIPVLLSNKKLP